MVSITIEQLHEFFKKLGGRDLILDVRTPEEFSDGHVPGAKNIPVDQVEGRVAELQGIDHLYIYCRAGRRADMAAGVIQTKGLDQLKIQHLLVVDDGGFPNWEGEGYSIEK